MVEPDGLADVDVGLIGVGCSVGIVALAGR
jgi:hypothetical protein